MLCEQALELYRKVEAAVERGSGVYAKEKLTELRLFLKSQTQHSAFRGADSYLPRAKSNPYEWKPDLAQSRGYVESYLRELECKP
jgi:hypothetical protein